MDEPQPSGCSPVGAVAVLVSVLCLAPTVLTIGGLCVASVFQLVVALFVMADSPQHGIPAFLWATAITMVPGFVAALPISVLSVLLHPIGGAAAVVARRSGARGLGMALAGIHLVTFFAGAAVLAVWVLLIVAGQFS